MDVSDALMDYLTDSKHLGKKTQAGYGQRLSVFAEWASLQGVQLEQVNNRNVQAFLTWLAANHRPHSKGKQQLSSHTIASYVRCIWAFLYWCVKERSTASM